MILLVIVQFGDELQKLSPQSVVRLFSSQLEKPALDVGLGGRILLPPNV